MSPSISNLLLTKFEFNFPPIDVAPVHMKRILTSPDLFEISLILEATRQGLQYNQILYRQNRYVEFAKAERVNDVETPSCMKLLSKDRACWWWSSVWVD